VRGEVLHRSGLGRLQLEELLAVLVLRELLARPLELRGKLDALGLQAAPVVGADLGELLLRLRDQRLARADDERLRAQVLLLLDPPGAARSW
jgi:hypothetical protein